MPAHHRWRPGCWLAMPRLRTSNARCTRCLLDRPAAPPGTEETIKAPVTHRDDRKGQDAYPPFGAIARK